MSEDLITPYCWCEDTDISQGIVCVATHLRCAGESDSGIIIILVIVLLQIFCRF